MPTPKQLPNGRYKVRVYDYTDLNGHKHYKAFTGNTKEDAQLLASEFQASKHRIRTHDMTVYDAINGYILTNKAVLSPSTIRTYTNLQKHFYEPINSIKLSRLDKSILQSYVSELSVNYAPKTIRNVFTLLNASIGFYTDQKPIKVKFPTTKIKPPTMANNDDIKALYTHASEWLQKCILLSAFGSLRRAEISALRYGDIDRSNNTIYIYAVYVMDEHNTWIYKEHPKTAQSVRYVTLPSEVIKLLGTGPDQEQIISYNPNTITKMFIKLRNRLGINIKFHDLRKYYASIGAILHIPDIYLAKYGGWSATSPIMKTTYQGTNDAISMQYSNIMTNYFANMFQDMT